jgi:hypothetical protein
MMTVAEKIGLNKQQAVSIIQNIKEQVKKKR